MQACNISGARQFKAMDSERTPQLQGEGSFTDSEGLGFLMRRGTDSCFDNVGRPDMSTGADHGPVGL